MFHFFLVEENIMKFNEKKKKLRLIFNFPPHVLMNLYPFVKVDQIFPNYS